MKKIIITTALACISCVSTSYAAGVCQTGTLTTTYNPFTGRPDYVCTGFTGGGGGGSSPISVGTGTAANYTTQITSPTQVFSFLGSQFKSAGTGTTNFISIDPAANISVSTLTAKSINSTTNVTISDTRLPTNGGIGPQVTVPFIWATSNVDLGTSVGFTIHSSTSPPKFGSGGATIDGGPFTELNLATVGQFSVALGTTTYNFPLADGVAGQFLKTDGSGNWSFGTPGAGSSILNQNTLQTGATAFPDFVYAGSSLSVNGQTSSVVLLKDPGNAISPAVYGEYAADVGASAGSVMVGVYGQSVNIRTTPSTTQHAIGTLGLVQDLTNGTATAIGTEGRALVSGLAPEYIGSLGYVDWRGALTPGTTSVLAGVESRINVTSNGVNPISTGTVYQFYASPPIGNGAEKQTWTFYAPSTYPWYVNGNIGISSSTPQDKLVIQNSGSYILFGEPTGGVSAFTFNAAPITLANYAMAGNAGNVYFNRNTGGSLFFSEANAAQITVAPGGDTTFTGKVTASTVVASLALQLPSGTNPQILTTGNMAVDTSSGQVVVNNGTDNVVLSSTYSKTFNLETPAAGDFPIGWRTNTDVTVTSLVCVSSAATSTTISFLDCAASDGTSCNTLWSGASCGTTEFSVGLSSAVAVDRRIRMKVTATSGTPGWVGADVYYRETRK